MSKDLTIKKRTDFLRVAKGVKVVTTSVVLQAALSLCEYKTSPKFGYTATKKIGKAHIRNKAKRRIRAVISQVLADTSKPNVEYVIIARHNTPTYNFEDLKDDITHAIKKANKLLGDKPQCLKS